MHINHFGNEVEEKILKRGQQYFADGVIDELWQASDGSYHAVVDGSEPYEVTIDLDASGEIADHPAIAPTTGVSIASTRLPYFWQSERPEAAGQSSRPSVKRKDGD